MSAAVTGSVFVVEDNRDTSALLHDLLEAEGYTVEAAASGEAALEALERSAAVDLLVVDLMLPGISGYELIERVRAHPELATVPVLVLSALGSASARVRGLRDGADDYMTKPFLPEELVARVRTLVARHLLAQRTRELEALGGIAEAALTETRPEPLLRRLVGAVTDVFAAEAAALLLRDDEGGPFRERAAAGLGGHRSAVVLPADHPVAAAAFRTGGPVGADADDVAPAFRAAGLRALTVVRRIGEGVVVTDADDRVVFANRAFHEMVGAGVGSLVGRPWTTFLSTAQDTGALTARMRAGSFEGELLLITRDGEPRPVLATLSSERRPDGRLERIGVFRDISREHELRFRLIREQKFRTLGSLAAGVAHNINNRLTPVLGWTEMLLERLAGRETIPPDELSHALRVISQGASDSVETVRRLQEYARPTGARGPEAVQLREVVEQLLALTRPQWDNEAARRGVRYEIDLRVEPAPAILAVASEVREALLNILENALAAMRHGGRLGIHIRGAEGRAVISVADTGPGMSPEVQRLAFEPFFTTRSSEGGSGLGLALAQEIVQRYGGSIELASREGVGTVFTLSFPALTGAREAPPAFLPALEPLRIMAVEDEPEVLDVLRAMLESAGHTVITAASGREALELVGREELDVVVTDLGMPGMTGLSLAVELKRRRSLPVVLLTGWADELAAEVPPAVDLVLAKPVTRDRLLLGLARVVPDRVRP